MTPRERILCILRGEKPDRVPWFGDLDYWATARIQRGEFPADFKKTKAYIDWHRDLKVGYYLQGDFPFTTIIENCHVKTWQQGNKRYRQIETPKGTLRECWQWMADSFTEAPIEYLVKSIHDLSALTYVHEHCYYEPNYKFTENRREWVGDIGIVLDYLPKSPFMQLVALEAGIEIVTLLALSYPDEFAETMHIMEKSHDKAAMIAMDSPAEVLMIPENLSAEVVGPFLFEKYMRGYQEKWSRKINQSGKYSFIHMDGTLKALLKEEGSVGFSVLEALTPKPVGDLAIEEWESYTGDSKSIFWGGIPGSCFTPSVSDAEFECFIKHVLSIMRKEPKYVLGVADQVPPDGLESRVRRVSEIVAVYGAFE